MNVSNQKFTIIFSVIVATSLIHAFERPPPLPAITHVPQQEQRAEHLREFNNTQHASEHDRPTFSSNAILYEQPITRHLADLFFDKIKRQLQPFPIHHLYERSN